MWGRLDVKIAERRVVLPNGQILRSAARVLGDFYQRDAPRRVQLPGAHAKPEISAPERTSKSTHPPAQKHGL
jgi:hypothetical protein